MLYLLSAVVFGISALIGIAGAIYFKDRKNRVASKPIVCLTTSQAADQIASAQRIESFRAIHAYLAKNVSGVSGLTLLCRTLIPPNEAQRLILLPESVWPHFQRVFPFGPYTLWMFLNGHYYAPYKELDLRSGNAVQRILLRSVVVIYAPDVLCILVCLMHLYVLLSYLQA